MNINEFMTPQKLLFKITTLILLLSLLSLGVFMARPDQQVFAVDQYDEGDPLKFKTSTFETQDVQTPQELSLRQAGCLSVNPTTIFKLQEPGTAEATTLSITNTCTESVEFSIKESADILWEGFEDFDLGYIDQYNGWEAEQGDNGETNNRWEIKENPEYVYEGRHYAWVGYDDLNLSDEWLWSPMVNISNLTNPYLTFSAYSTTEYPGATMEVWVTDSVGSKLSTGPIWDLINDEVWGTAEHRSVFLDLGDFVASGSIRIAWHYVGQEGNSFALDFVEVGGDWNLPWLSTSTANGSISPGSQAVVTLSFNSTGLTTETYNGAIFVEKATEESIRVPVSLQIVSNVYENFIPLILR